MCTVSSFAIPVQHYGHAWHLWTLLWGYRCTDRLRQAQDDSACAASSHLEAQAAVEQAQGSQAHTSRLLACMRTASSATAMAHGQRAHSQQCERQAAEADCAATRAAEEHSALLKHIGVRNELMQSPSMQSHLGVLPLFLFRSGRRRAGTDTRAWGCASPVVLVLTFCVRCCCSRAI